MRMKERQENLRVCVHVCACCEACAEGGVERGNISDLLVHLPPSSLSVIY